MTIEDDINMSLFFLLFGTDFANFVNFFIIFSGENVEGVGGSGGKDGERDLWSSSTKISFDEAGDVDGGGGAFLFNFGDITIVSGGGGKSSSLFSSMFMSLDESLLTDSFKETVSIRFTLAVWDCLY